MFRLAFGLNGCSLFMFYFGSLYWVWLIFYLWLSSSNIYFGSLYRVWLILDLWLSNSNRHFRFEFRFNYFLDDLLILFLLCNDLVNNYHSFFAIFVDSFYPFLFRDHKRMILFLDCRVDNLEFFVFGFLNNFKLFFFYF